MEWEREYTFKQTTLAVRRKDGTRHDTFCTALVVGWLTEEAGQPDRSMHSDQLEGHNHEVMRLYKAQVALREAQRDGGLPVLLQSRGLSRFDGTRAKASRILTVFVACNPATLQP